MAVHRFKLANLVRRVAVAAVLGIMLTPSPAVLVARAAQPVPAAGQRADFNGDGFDDLAVGAAFEDLGGVLDAGAVNVLYGSAVGLAPQGAQVWTQDSPGVPGTAEQGEHFGAALAAGDFDADGFGDLAIWIQGDRNGGVGAGAVTVLYGSARGLTATGAQLWTPDSPGVPGNTQSEDSFGTALAAGDLNNDRVDDLAVGAPNGDVGAAFDAGDVIVLYGAAATGLTATGAQLWSQDSPGVPGLAELGDGFGHALATGDVNGDTVPDLAVGVSLESIGVVTDAGAVNLLLGSTAGLTSRGAQVFTQDSPGVPGLAEPFDQLGFDVALGDANGDGFADLAAGVESEDVGTVADAGAVQMLYGSAAGLATVGAQLWTEDSPGVADQAEVDDNLGFSVTLGDADADADGDADLAAGAIGEPVGNAGAAGAVAVLAGSPAGLTAAGSRLLTQDSPGVPGTAEIGDRLGFGAVTGDFDGDGLADAAAGAWTEAVGSIAQAGAVNVLYGSAAGLAGGQLFTQDTPGIPGVAEADDLFGGALAADR
jgi:FG-GAP repeat